jgi:hypothetical protein
LGLFVLEFTFADFSLDARDEFPVKRNLGRIIERGNRVLDLLLDVFLLDLVEAILQFLIGQFLDIFLFHNLVKVLNELSGIIVATNDKLSSDGKFLSGKAQSLLGDIKAHAVDLDEDATGVNGSDVTSHITFTFTHADVGRLACVRLVGEDAQPDLTLALHVTCHGDTGCLDLASGDPLALQSLDSEGTESELVATLAVLARMPVTRTTVS